MDYDKCVQVVYFSGKHTDWRMWSLKFLSYAGLKGYKDVLLGTETVPKADDIIDDKDDVGKKLLQARKNNSMAYSALVLACQDEVSFGAVEEVQTEDLPDGDVALAWKILLAIYQPDTTSNKVALLQEFTSNILKDAMKNSNT